MDLWCSVCADAGYARARCLWALAGVSPPPKRRRAVPHVSSPSLDRWVADLPDEAVQENENIVENLTFQLVMVDG